ncbi:MAG: hemolysin family protein [Anaerolineaceae bacterium]|nr:hemolysin family protein [Anaerolineaceae bacterium]MDD4042652.1 hemolysin family protein [Anaerolineaceae bacterium]
MTRLFMACLPTRKRERNNVTDPILLGGVWAVFFVAALVSSAAKSAFTHVRLPWLLSLRIESPNKVDKTIALIEKQGLRTALRLGLIIAHYMLAGATVLLLVGVAKLVNIWFILLILLLVLVIVTAFEFMLERKILKSSEKAALTWTGAATVISFLVSPITRLMTAILGEYAERVSLAVTDESLRDWVEQDQPESTLDQGEREMIYSIFHFSETMTKEIMVPRMDVLALDVNTTIREARQEFINAGHSRVPVYDDTVDNVIGLLYAKDLLAVVDGDDTIANQRSLIRPAYFVPEAKKVDELLTEMQSRGVHMALVVDEYGGVAGVVTLEDIVEEIVGEIRDEYDQGEVQLYEELPEGGYLIQGRATIDEFNEITGLNLSDEYADTLGGYIYGQLGRVPQPGEMVRNDNFDFTVEEVVARRILKVKVQKVPEPTTADQEVKNEGSDN